MNAREIRDNLRKGKSASLKRRRNIAVLSALGLVDFSILSLYQTGAIKRLPDLPGKIFQSEKVNGSDDAYQFGLPDSPVSAGVYSLNLMLASYRGSKETGRPVIADIALGVTAFLNAGGAAYYLYNMITKQKVACPYCLVGAAINFITLPIALKEAFFSWKNR